MLPRFRFVCAGVACKHVEPYIDALKELRIQMQSPVELVFDLPRRAVGSDRPGRDIRAHGAPDWLRQCDPARNADVNCGSNGELRLHACMRDPGIRVLPGRRWRNLSRSRRSCEAHHEDSAVDRRGVEEHEDRAIERAYRKYADELVFRTMFEDWHRLIGEKRPSEFRAGGSGSGGVKVSVARRARRGSKPRTAPQAL